MMMTNIARLGGAAALTLSLAACMDVSMSINVLDEAEAEATMVTSMGADMYAMIEAQSDEDEDAFCEDGETIETATTVDCVVTKTGAFDELQFEEDDGGPAIEAIGNGQVRVSFPTGDLTEEVAQGMGAEEDPEMLAMITSMFEGHFITLNVSGGDITDTNMDMGADGTSATYQIPFIGLLNGELNLPDELFAVVQK